MRLISLAMFLFAVPLLGRAPVRQEAMVSGEPLTIQVELESANAGKIVLANRGSADLRLWNMGNSWGDETLSFEVTWDGRSERVTRKPQDYTRNVPSSAVVAPNRKHQIPFDLRDGTWEPAEVIDRLTSPGAQITAVYSVRKSPEALSHDVWTGELRSQPVRLK